MFVIPYFAERLAKLKGAGDAVALVAQPVAKGLDALLGTDLQNCGGCKERQADWNEKFPLNAPPAENPPDHWPPR